jgi:hypothetical protein
MTRRRIVRDAERAAAGAALVAVLLSWPASAMSQRTTIRTGTISVPDGFAVHERRGTDSYPGMIVRADSALVVEYDIGAMAGARVHPSRRGEYAWLVEHEVAGHRAYTGLSSKHGRRRISTTILGDGTDPWTLPANFSADVRDERDVTQFTLIVASYRPGRRR